MKIGFFTDSHYSSAKLTHGCRYNSRALEEIKKAFAFFSEQKCGLVICLGDLIDHENVHLDEIFHLQEISAVIKKHKLKTIVLMGNHDAFSFSQKEFYDILGEDCKPNNFKINEKNFFFLDACHFKNGRHYTPDGGDWTDTYVPNLTEFSQQLENAFGDCYVFMHQNVDANIREDHRIANDNEFRTIIERSQKVKTVYQGHYHPGYQSKKRH